MGNNNQWYRRKFCLAFFIVGTIVFLALLLFGVKVFFLIQKINRGEIAIPDKYLTNRILAANVNINSNLTKIDVDTGDDPALGPKGTLVTIVEFSDFECPISEQVHTTIEEMVKIYGNKIRYVFRDFPVTYVHDYAEKAAEAGECAHEQGKFWEYHVKLFANQKNLTEDALKQYAGDIGLDRNRFINCLDSDKYAAEVKQDIDDGILAGVRGTPTWFIDGVKVEGIIPADKFVEIIDEQIKINTKNK